MLLYYIFPFRTIFIFEILYPLQNNRGENEGNCAKFGKSIYLSSTMSAGIKIDPKTVEEI